MAPKNLGASGTRENRILLSVRHSPTSFENFQFQLWDIFVMVQKYCPDAEFDKRCKVIENEC